MRKRLRALSLALCVLLCVLAYVAHRNTCHSVSAGPRRYNTVIEVAARGGTATRTVNTVTAGHVDIVSADTVGRDMTAGDTTVLQEGGHGRLTVDIECHSHATGDRQEQETGDELAYEYNHRPMTDADVSRTFRNCTAFRNYRSRINVDRNSRTFRVQLDCKKLVNKDKVELMRAEEMSKIPYAPLEAADYIRMTSNCTEFRSHYTMSADTEEEAFPLAFSIRMHTSIEQAERLLRAIYRPHNVYCIHIDSKSSPSLHEAMAAIASCLPNVRLASRMVDYGYGTFSPVEADLICMKDLMHSGVHWKYLLNMAGTEFPLKTNKEIVTVLQYLNGTNDIEQLPFFPQLRQRYEYKWKRYGGYIINTNVSKSSFPGVQLLKGCSYNSMSRAFVAWVLTDAMVADFLAWSRDTSAPDETVWATLNNHPQAPGGYPVMVTQTSKTFLSREVIWQWGSAYCHSQLRHQICLLSFRELPWLARRWELFANKFDLEVNHLGYGCLEELLLERSRTGQVAIPWHGIDRAPHVYFTRVLHRNITQAARERLTIVPFPE